MIVGIIHYGAGNMTSVANAVQWVGHEPRFVTNRAEMESVAALILPGVGAFGHAMARLQDIGMVTPLLDWAAAGKPLLGICLGMQLMAKGSEEGGWNDGLGLIDGTIRAIPPSPGIHIPHMGWNEVNRVKPGALWGDADNIVVYHVHSYHLEFASSSEKERWLTGIVAHGTELTSMVEADNVMATQFHPEKSQRDGLMILQNFFSFADAC